MINNDPLETVDADANFLNRDIVYDNEVRLSEFDADSFNRFVNESFVESTESLSLIHINIRSLARNNDSFTASLETLNLNFDIIAVTETWLRDPSQDVYFSSYNSCHSVRNERIGGGTAIYMKNHLCTNELTQFNVNSPDLECVFAEIKDGDGRVVVGCVYRPPNGSIAVFLHELCTMLSRIDPGGTDTLLCGDFNLDMLQIETNVSVADFYNNLLTLSLFPCITVPTHIYNNRDGQLTGSLLDNIFLSNRNHLKSGVLNFDVSDHLPIFILYNRIFKYETWGVKDTFKYRVLNDQTIGNFIEEISAVDFDSVVPETIDCDLVVSAFNSKIFEIYDRTCPIKTKILTQKDKKSPWVNHDLKVLIKKRNYYYKKMKQGDFRQEPFRVFRNYVTNCLRNAKKQYYNNLFLSIKNNIKKTWQTINNTLKPFRSRNSNLIEKIVYNNVETRGSEVSEAFNWHFASVGERINRSFQSTGARCMLQSSTPNSIFISDVSTDEIINIVTSMKDKPCHISALPIKILKSIINIIAPFIAKILNISLKYGIFPDSLKIARVVPIYKSGDPTDLNNYRPISVLPTLSKIFERAMSNRVNGFFEKFRVLNANQYGFRKGKSDYG